MGCFSCICPPSKDVRDYDGDITPRSVSSAGSCFVFHVFHQFEHVNCCYL